MALFKRLFDILISILGLIFLVPIFIYFAWRIKRDSPGPVIYRGLRAGKSGKTFSILKFRTMFESPESYAGSLITGEDDARITPIGAWLRETKLNELPQLWNVLKGDMSLVGPRPEDPQIVAGWPDKVRQEVLSMRPGITSPASVIYRDEEKLLNGIGFMDIYMEDILPSKLRLDQLYVRYHSIWNDMDVLFYTFLLLLPRLSKSSPGEQNLIVGPFNNFIRRNFSWFAVDTLVTFVAISLVGLLWRSFGPLHVGWLTALIFGILFALIFSISSALFGVQKIYWSRSSGTDALDLLLPVGIATAIMMAINQFVLMVDPDNPYRVVISIPSQQPLFPAAMILLASALSFVGFVVVRYRSRIFSGIETRWGNIRGTASPSQERALIVGGGETGQFASIMLTGGTYRNMMRIVGFVDDDYYKLGSRIQGINVIGRCSDIPELVSNHDIGVIIFAIHKIDPDARRKILEICASTPVRTIYFPDLPATISDIVYREKGIGDDKSQTSDQIYVPLSSISDPQVYSWLDQLEHTANQGDMDLLLDQLQDMKGMVNIYKNKMSLKDKRPDSP